jgi:ABC-type phosphate transport system substrate-binding protein
VFVHLTLSPRHNRGALRAALCAGGVAAVLGLAAGAEAQATTACDSLPGTKIYGVGGSAPTPLVKRVARILAAQPEAERITVVYQDTGACFAMQGLVGTAGTPPTPITGTAKYWTADSDTDQTCSLPAQGVEAQWGSMAQLPTTCPGITALPDTVGDYLGPISGFSIIANKDSSEEVISAEALYSIYGLGPVQANIAPWTNLATLGSRTTTSAAGLLLAKAVGIPLSRPLAGSDDRSQGGVITKLTSATATADQAALDSTLGFVSTEAAEASSAVTRVKQLAYQHREQLVGYYPNSTATSLDKSNIREGRYFLWNPHHFYAKKSGSEITDPAVRTFVHYFTGEEELPGTKSFLDVTIENGNIPDCAMQVTRDDDMGPLQSYQPDEPCGCYFEFKATGAASSSCTECDADTDCTDSNFPTCRLGYCEVK